MRYRAKLMLAVLGGAGLIVGCASKPSRQPRILSSYTPPGAGQPAPLNTSQPIQVPAASVGVRPAAVAVPAQPAQAVPVVPAQAIPAQQVPTQQLVPAQPGQQLVPANPNQANPTPPANSQQFQNNNGSGSYRGFQQQQPQTGPAGRLTPPDPDALN